MTPTQYYFPYFFDHTAFNKTLIPFGLSSYLVQDSKTQMPKELVITEKHLFNFSFTNKRLLTVTFGATLMIKGSKLFYWYTETNLLDIIQVDLRSLIHDPELLNTKIDLSQLHVGENSLQAYLDLSYLVTYARKDDIIYEQDYYENFVIVVISKKQTQLTPFDWFNKTKGDYGYVWPAIAQLDIQKNMLYGKGMRMSDFSLELNHPKV